MLILRLTIGQWVEITGRDGATARVKVHTVKLHEGYAAVELCFDDDDRHFEYDRLTGEGARP